MSALNSEVVTFALQKIGVVAENEAPSAEQGITALTILNDGMANEQADGWRLGWFPQTTLAATAPLRDSDIGPAKLVLARWLAAHYGIKIQDPLLIEEIKEAERKLTKRSLRYFESDLSELSRPQGGPFGGPSWF